MIFCKKGLNDQNHGRKDIGRVGFRTPGLWCIDTKRISPSDFKSSS